MNDDAQQPDRDTDPEDKYFPRETVGQLYDRLPTDGSPVQVYGFLIRRFAEVDEDGGVHTT